MKLGPVRERVLQMRKADMSGPEIAKALGISSQRVYQHLKALRELGMLNGAKR